MTTKNLIDAFGAIDDNIFEKAEIRPSEDTESYPEKIVTTEKRSMRPLFIAAMGIAAAVAAAVALPMLSDGRLDNPPFEENTSNGGEITSNVGESTSNAEENTSVTANEPDLYQWESENGYKLFTDSKTPFDAAEIYSVTETVLQAGETYSTDGELSQAEAPLTLNNIPAYIDGEDFYYTMGVSYDPFAVDNGGISGWIVLKRNGEEITLLNDAPRNEKHSLEFIIQGVYDGYLYYCRNEYSDEAIPKLELCRVNIATHDNGIICPVSMGRFARSGDYLYFSDYAEGGCTVYRYNTVEGELETFKQGAEYPSPYKGGIVYLQSSDYSVYFHSEDSAEDILLYNQWEKKDGQISVLDTAGSDRICCTYPLYYSDDGTYRGSGFGIINDNYGCTDIIEPVNEGYALNSHSGDTDIGLVGLAGDEIKKPLIFDTRTNSLAELNVEGKNFHYINSSADCICVAGYDKERDGSISDPIIYTIRRKVDVSAPDIGINLAEQETEIYIYNTELKRAEERYPVTVNDSFDENLINTLRAHDVFGSFINGNDIFYTAKVHPEDLLDDPSKNNKTARIYRSDLEGVGNASLLLEEAPQAEENGLYYNIIGVIDNYLYYERMEIYSDPDSVGDAYEVDFELYRINLRNNETEFILKLGWVLGGKYAISGNNIYIGEICYNTDYDPYHDKDDKLYRIWRYNTVTGETELFRDNARDPYPFKEGIIYQCTDIGAVYYHSDSSDTDTYLFERFVTSLFTAPAFGGDIIAVNHDNKSVSIMEENDGGSFAERKFIEGYHVNAAGNVAPCKGFIPIGNRPMFYDEENDWFAWIIDIGTDKNNWSWIRSSEDTLCLGVFGGDNGNRVERIYTVRK